MQRSAKRIPRLVHAITANPISSMHHRGIARWPQREAVIERARRTLAKWDCRRDRLSHEIQAAFDGAVQRHSLRNPGGDGG